MLDAGDTNHDKACDLTCLEIGAGNATVADMVADVEKMHTNAGVSEYEIFGYAMRRSMNDDGGVSKNIIIRIAMMLTTPMQNADFANQDGYKQDLRSCLPISHLMQILYRVMSLS